MKLLNCVTVICTEYVYLCIYIIIGSTFKINQRRKMKRIIFSILLYLQKEIGHRINRASFHIFRLFFFLIDIRLAKKKRWWNVRHPDDLVLSFHSAGSHLILFFLPYLCPPRALVPQKQSVPWLHAKSHAQQR